MTKFEKDFQTFFEQFSHKVQTEVCCFLEKPGQKPKNNWSY